MRRINVPPDGCWQSTLRIWWKIRWKDDTPERCQREPSPPPMAPCWRKAVLDELTAEAERLGLYEVGK